MNIVDQSFYHLISLINGWRKSKMVVVLLKTVFYIRKPLIYACYFLSWPVYNKYECRVLISGRREEYVSLISERREEYLWWSLREEKSTCHWSLGEEKSTCHWSLGEEKSTCQYVSVRVSTCQYMAANAFLTRTRSNMNLNRQITRNV